MTRYMMPARSQGKLYEQRRHQAERDTHRWLLTRLNGFYCELQLMYTPPLQSMARNDDAVEVDARDAVKTLTKATGLNPHRSVPGSLDDAHTGGGAI